MISSHVHCVGDRRAEGSRRKCERQHYAIRVTWYVSFVSHSNSTTPVSKPHTLVSICEVGITGLSLG